MFVQGICVSGRQFGQTNSHGVFRIGVGKAEDDHTPHPVVHVLQLLLLLLLLLLLVSEAEGGGPLRGGIPHKLGEDESVRLGY